MTAAIDTRNQALVAIADSVELVRAIRLVAPVKRKHGSFRLLFEHGSIRVEANDGLTWASIAVPAQTTSPGPVQINAPTLLEALRGARGPITINALRHRAIIAGADRTIIVPTDHPEEFAAPPPGAPQGKVFTRSLYTTMQRSAASMSADDCRPHLYGMLLEISDGQLRAISTDGHRLTKSTTATASKASLSALLSRDSVRPLLRMLARRQGVTAISRAEPPADSQPGMAYGGFLSFVSGPVCVTARCVNATFPQYSQVVPLSQEKSVTLPRVALARFCRLARAAWLKPIGLRSVPHGIEMYAGQDLLQVVPATSTAAIQIAAQPQYLLDVCNACTGDSITLHMSGELDPMTVEEQGLVYVVMPARGA